MLFGRTWNRLPAKFWTLLPALLFTLLLASLPWVHRDPFDRMLVAQAAEEKLSLLTVDATLRRYGRFVRLV